MAQADWLGPKPVGHPALRSIYHANQLKSHNECTNNDSIMNILSATGITKYCY